MLVCHRCHRVIIPDYDTYTATDAGAIVHTTCHGHSTLYTVLLLILLGFVAFTARADEKKKPPDTDVKGCIATYISSTGKFLYEPFIKTADKETPSENGEAEIWGFNPWNLGEPDENGKVYPVNVLASRFIPMNVFQKVPAGTAHRDIRCPPYW